MVYDQYLAMDAYPERYDTFKAVGEWYALHTNDQDAVLAEFGLSDPVVVPANAGTLLWPLSGASWDHSLCAMVYVSPAVNGWTLVFGVPVTKRGPRRRLPYAGHQDWQGSPPRIVISELKRLSRRFGRVCHFRNTWLEAQSVFEEDNANVWRLADDGEITGEFLLESADFVSERWVRLGAVDAAEYDTWLRRELIDEKGFGRRRGETMIECARRWLEKWGPDYAPATYTLGPLSSSAVTVQVTGWFQADLRVEGTGVLALTDCGRRFGDGELPSPFAAQ